MVWLLMALHILNLSADTADADPAKPEDLSVNDMETVAEVIVEGILGMVDAFPESDERDEPDGQSLGIKKVSFYFQQYRVQVLTEFKPVFETEPSAYIIPFCSERYSDVLNPPPEV